MFAKPEETHNSSSRTIMRQVASVAGLAMDGPKSSFPPFPLIKSTTTKTIVVFGCLSSGRQKTC